MNGMTLTEWLRDQLDADERAAYAAGGTTWLADRDPALEGRINEVETGEVVVYDEGRPSGDEALHIAAWDPARVLAEVKAKRTRIDYLADLAARCPADDWPESGGMELAPMADLARWLLKLDAQPYAGRGGWRDEWSVTE